MKQRIALASFFIFVIVTLSEPLWAARLELRPLGSDSSITSVMVGDEIEVELWIDSERQPISGAAVFLSFDEKHLALVNEDRATQTGFQPFAPGGFLSNGEIFRNYLLDEADPAASAPGTQLDYSVVRAADQGAGPIASFRLRALMPTAQLHVRIDESGTRETRFFLPDGDQKSFRFITPLQLSVQGITIRDLPNRIVLPRNGTHQLTLRDHIFDPQFGADEITWTLSPLGALQAHHDVEQNALILRAPDDASPWEQLVLTARNPSGQTASDTVEVFVNDHPTFSPIGTISLNEDAPYELALEAFVSDVDTPFNHLQWRIDTPPELSVQVDGETRTAIITPAADWYGQSRIELIVCDPFDFADTLQVDIDVSSVNDPPQLITSPNLRLTRGRSDNSLLLSALIADAEDASEDLKLSWVGDENVQLEVVEGRLIVSANTDWTGREEITLIVEDSGQLKDSGPLVVTIVPSLAPNLVAQPDHLSLASGESHVLSLDELVVDPDDADDALIWHVIGHRELSVQLSGNRKLRIEAPNGFIGVETLLFTVTDPTGEQTSFSLKVYSLPASGEPLLATLPEIRVPLDGVDASIDLDLYVFDLDHDPSEINFFLPHRKDVALRVDEQSHVLVIQPQAGAVASVLDLEVRAIDPDGHQATQILRLYLLDANGQSGPQLTLLPLPDLELSEGQIYTFSLDDHVTGDVAVSDISWSTAESEHIAVNIDPADRFVSLQIKSGWYGETTIEFVARAGELLEQRLNLHIRTSAPTPSEGIPSPTLAQLPDISLEAGAFDQSIDLDQFIDHASPTDFVWNISGGQNARVLFDAETNKLIVFAGEDWEGEEIFDLVGLSDDGTRLETTLRVAVILPVLTISLTEQTEVVLLAGTEEIRLHLSELLTGTADPRSIQWSAHGLQPVEVLYDEESDELVLTRIAPWQDSDRIELRASLADGTQAIGLVMAQVYPTDGSIKSESEDFVLVPLPNALQPEFIDLFLIDRTGTTAQPQLRLNDGTWSDLALQPGPEHIWQSSYVLAPGQNGSVSIVALSLVDNALYTSSYEFEVGTVYSGRGKVIAHTNMTLEVEANAFERKSVVALLPSPVRNTGPELIPQSLAYTAHSPQSYTGEGVYLRTHESEIVGSKTGIYRYKESQWHWIRATHELDGLRVELDELGQYALMEDRTPPQATRRTEQSLYLIDRGSGISHVEVLSDSGPISSAAYSWEGEQLLFHADQLTERDHTLHVRVTDNAGNVNTLNFSTQNSGNPQSFSLLQNFPNPFNPSTSIPLTVQSQQPVYLAVYNSTGQRVRLLADRPLSPGRHVLQWDARDDEGHPVSSGIYLYRLIVDGQIQMRKMTLMR